MEPASMPYKDRSGGLIAFGVMTLLLGVSRNFNLNPVSTVTPAGGVGRA